MWDALLDVLVSSDQPISAHLVRAVLFALWLPFLLVKLSLIDRRDILTALDYIGYGLGSGVLLLWGLPAVLPIKSSPHGLLGHALWLCAILALTVWNFYRIKTDSHLLDRQRMLDGQK